MGTGDASVRLSQAGKFDHEAQRIFIKVPVSGRGESSSSQLLVPLDSITTTAQQARPHGHRARRSRYGGDMGSASDGTKE